MTARNRPTGPTRLSGLTDREFHLKLTRKRILIGGVDTTAMTKRETD
jgi:hypothetical protein